MQSRVLDIGVGGNPYFLRFQKDCDADQYVAIDSDEKRLNSTKSILSVPLPFKAPKEKEFFLGDASELPFKDRSFSLAVLSNVLSAPIHNNWDLNSPDHKAEGFGLKDLFYVERKKVVSEALRVLEPNGRILIYTDLIVHGQYSYDMILRELQNDPLLSFKVLADEQRRIDDLNIQKVLSGNQCHCFLADLLPSSAVYEITKI